MKNFLNLIFTAALIVWGCLSCQKISIEGEPSGWADRVKITLNSPSQPATKAIGDGKKAKEVYYTAFVDGSSVPSLCSKTILDADGHAVLDLNLVRNVTYTFVFWAQSPVEAGETPAYDLSTFYTDSKVKINYEGYSNDDSRDAFCAVKTISVKGKENETIYLRRPFAQINFGSSDYLMLKQLGLHDGMTSVAEVHGLADVLTVLDGSVGYSAGKPVNTSFAAAPIPSGEDEYITVAESAYGYVGMNYVLASEVGEMVSVKGIFYNGTTSWETVQLPNVPVRRNYKTNIVGDIFSEQATIQIIVVPDFNDPDEIVGI